MYRKKNMHEVACVVVSAVLLLGGAVGQAAVNGITYTSSADAYAGYGVDYPTYGYYSVEIANSNFTAAVNAGTLIRKTQTDSNSSAGNGSGVFSAAANPSYSNYFPIYETVDPEGKLVDPVFIPFNVAGNALVNGSGGFSALHAIAQVTANVTPADYIYTLNDERYGDQETEDYISPESFHGIASGTITATDTLTATSATLPNGTSVNVALTGTLDSLADDPQTAFSRGIDNTLATANFLLNGSSKIGLINYGEANATTTPQNQHTTVTVQIGVPFTIATSLSVKAEALADYYHPNDTATADASDTALINLDPIGANFSLISQSGTDYSTPAPEPLQVAEFGACAVMFRRCRRREK